jgi:hypothetical protein
LCRSTKYQPEQLEDEYESLPSLEQKWPAKRLVASERVRAVRRPRVSKLCQYSGIQIPKNQKPHPPNTGLNIGIAL